MDEKVDIVDSSDIVIGTGMKLNCHKNRILHRRASILVFKDQTYKELLLQKRSMQKMARPGKICIPGGHVSFGETYEHAAEREYYEEMYNNYYKEIIPFEYLFKFEKDADDDLEFMGFFRAVDAGPFIPDKEEVESSFFMNLSELFTDLSINQDKYTGTTDAVLREYNERCLDES